MLADFLFSHDAAPGGTWRRVVAPSRSHLDRVVYATEYAVGFTEIRRATFCVLAARDNGCTEIAEESFTWTSTRWGNHARDFDVEATYLPTDWVTRIEIPQGEDHIGCLLSALYFHLVILGRGPGCTRADRIVRALGRDYAEWVLVQRASWNRAASEAERRHRFDTEPEPTPLEATLHGEERAAVVEAFMRAGQES